MIEYIYGNLILKSPNYCIIDINGMGYKVNITNNGFDKLSNINTKVKLLIYFSVSENSQALFGFFDATERDLFLMLISISGIGPKTAINMLSSVTPQEFKDRLIAGEVKMLTMIPGVGPKTARRIIVELKDKFVELNSEDLPALGFPIMTILIFPVCFSDEMLCLIILLVLLYMFFNWSKY